MWAADGWTCARRTHTGTYLDWFCQPIFIKRCRGIFSCYASLLWNGGALKCLTALSSLLRPPPHSHLHLHPHLLPPSHSFSGSELQRCLPLSPSPLAEGTQPRLRGGLRIDCRFAALAPKTLTKPLPTTGSHAVLPLAGLKRCLCQSKHRQQGPPSVSEHDLRMTSLERH